MRYQATSPSPLGGGERRSSSLARVAGFGRLRQAIDRFRDVGGAGEQALDRTQIAGGARARERAVGVVGVDDSRFAVGDQDSVRIGVGDRLGGVEARRPGRELQQAKGEQEQAESAADGEDDDHPGQQRRADGARRKPQGQKSAGEAYDEDRERERIDGPLDSVHRRGRRRFHLRLKPRKDIAERERAELIAVARVLPWAASDVLTANRRTWAKVG